MFIMKPINLYLPLFMVFFIVLNYVYLDGAPFKKKDAKSLNIDYKISVDLENKEKFSVKAVISGIQTESLLLRMTANYGRVEKLDDLIPDITISSNGSEICGIEKINEFLWEIPINSSEIEIDYSINTRFPYSSLNMVRLPYRDENHIYFPASSVFIHPDEWYLEENSIKIEKIGIRFAPPPEWVVATSWGTGSRMIHVEPPEINNLNSGLIGLGIYRTYSTRIKGLILETVFLGKGPAPDADFNQVIIEALNASYKIFQFFPCNRFFVLFHFIFERPGQGSGNFLEWSSCLNYSRRFNDPRWLDKKSHIFHEIFHFWNGTEGPPLSRAQDDYSLIWFTEGITRYYQYKNMVAAGIINENELFNFMTGQFAITYHNSLRELNLDEISRQYYFNKDAFELTYSKGCCVAFALDLLIKKVSLGQKSFDDILKLMIKRYNYKDNGHTYSHEEVEETIKEVLGDNYFPSYKKLYGKDFVLEFYPILDKAGLSIQKKKGRRLYFGILNFGPPGGPVKVLSVDRESPAYAAGLRSGDILLEINGKKIKSPASIKELVKHIPENEPVKLTLERDDKKLKITTPWNSYATEFVINREEENLKDKL